jgi:thymidine kinase
MNLFFMCPAICMNYTKGEEMFKQISKSHQPYSLEFSSEEKLNNKSVYARSELASFSELKDFIERNKHIYMVEDSTPSYVLGSLLAWSRKIDYQEPQENKLINVFMGPMFAGKSHQLINCIGEKENALVFKHLFDIAREATHLYSRAAKDRKIPAMSVGSLEEIINFLRKKLNNKIEAEEIRYLFIDELQFFPDLSQDIIEKFLDIIKKHNIKVFASCLDQDYTGNVFENLKTLLVNYHNDLNIKKLQAWCQECEKSAAYTQRTDNGFAASHYQEKIKPDKNKETEETKIIEEIKTVYYPVCQEHHFMPNNEVYDIQDVSLFQFPLTLYSKVNSDSVL